MDADSRLEQADHLRYEGQYEEAIAIYDALLAEDEGNVHARHGRALCYCFTGLFEESIAELERVRNDDPRLVKAREDLFKTYLMLGMQDEAKAEMRAILELEPGNQEVLKHAAYFPDF